MCVLGREKQSVLASGRRSFGLCWCQCLLPAWKRCNMCKISESSWVRPRASDCWALFPALLLIWVMAFVGLSGQKFDIACPNCSLRNQMVSRHPLFLTASQNSSLSLLPPCFSTWIMEVIAQMYPSDAQRRPCQDKCATLASLTLYCGVEMFELPRPKLQKHWAPCGWLYPLKHPWPAAISSLITTFPQLSLCQILIQVVCALFIPYNVSSLIKLSCGGESQEYCVEQISNLVWRKRQQVSLTRLTFHETLLISIGFNFSL